jgi:hypothetical protein
VRATATTLSVQAEEVSLAEVLRAISAETGIEVRGELASAPLVSVDFELAPFPEAFRRVLGEQSYLLVYGGGEKPRRLQLLGAAAEAGVPPEPLAADAAATSEAAPVEAVSANAPPMPGSLRRHPLAPRLARAIGSDSGNFNQLVELAARTDDLALRRDAIRRGIGILDAEPELRTAVMATVQRSSPEQLARYLVFAAGPRAETVAAAIAEVVDEGPPRDRANAVVRQLQLMDR